MTGQHNVVHIYNSTQGVAAVSGGRVHVVDRVQNEFT